MGDLRSGRESKPVLWLRSVGIDEVAGNINIDDPTSFIENHEEVGRCLAEGDRHSTSCCSPPWLAITASLTLRKPPETLFSLDHLRFRSSGITPSATQVKAWIVRSPSGQLPDRTKPRAVDSIGLICSDHFQASNFPSSSSTISRASSPDAVVTTASTVVVL